MPGAPAKSASNNSTRVSSGASLSTALGFLGRHAVVEEYAYVGAAAKVRKYASVGAGSVVGMGSLVLDHVPPEEMRAGNPLSRLAPASRLIDPGPT